MVDRFGIQDHDQGIASTRLQNPTNQSSFSNIGDGGDSGHSAHVGAPPSFGLIISVIRILLAHRSPKSVPLAVVLALVFGPFGLLYSTGWGGLIMTSLTALAGFIVGGSMRAISDDNVMAPIWRVGVIVSVIWTVIAAKRRNASLQKSALKSSTKDGEL